MFAAWIASSYRNPRRRRSKSSSRSRLPSARSDSLWLWPRSRCRAIELRRPRRSPAGLVGPLLDRVAELLRTGVPGLHHGALAALQQHRGGSGVRAESRGIRKTCRIVTGPSKHPGGEDHPEPWQAEEQLAFRVRLQKACRGRCVFAGGPRPPHRRSRHRGGRSPSRRRSGASLLTVPSTRLRRPDGRALVGRHPPGAQRVRSARERDGLAVALSGSGGRVLAPATGTIRHQAARRSLRTSNEMSTFA